MPEVPATPLLKDLGAVLLRLQVLVDPVQAGRVAKYLVTTHRATTDLPQTTRRRSIEWRQNHGSSDRPHRSPALIRGLEALMAIRRLSADLGVGVAVDREVRVAVVASTNDRGVFSRSVATEQLVHNGDLADVARLNERQILRAGRCRR
jgi:hypothetical protein